jgi:hypothetical protein
MDAFPDSDGFRDNVMQALEIYQTLRQDDQLILPVDSGEQRRVTP